MNLVELKELSNSEMMDVLDMVMAELRSRVLFNGPNTPLKRAIKKSTNTDSLIWV